MNEAPVVLGINRTQDASICLMHGSQLVWAIQKERLTRQKHHWGKPGDLRQHYSPSLPGLERPIDVLVECFSSDAEIDALPDYEAELQATLVLAPGCRRARISHHPAHLYGVFHPSPFREAAVMVVDGQGSPAAEFTEHWSGAGSVPGDWRSLLAERGRLRYGRPGVSFSECANLAAAGQRAFEDALLAVARWLHGATGMDNLCFAGGAALNCPANERLLRETPFQRVFIPPAPSDAGTALGCALYGLVELARAPYDYRWRDAYLGPQPRPDAIDAALEDVPDLIVERIPNEDALRERMLDLPGARKVVALYQGRSEFGPRALGHRSILGDPRRSYIRDWINARVKQREWFRPLAPVVLAEHADAYFDVPGASPFMQYAAPVRAGRASTVPAITHVDGTARLQTVGPDDDPLLRALLAGFAERTGVPVLLNTSFNGKDEPIVETPAQAVTSFRRMPPHALAMPPYLVTERAQLDLPELPE